MPEYTPVLRSPFYQDLAQEPSQVLDQIIDLDLGSTGRRE